MKLKYISISTIALLCLALVGCPSGNTSGPVSSGDNDIHGTFILKNGYLNVDSNRSGFIVTVQSPKWQGSDTTAADGSWSVADPPAGVYEISARRGVYTSGIVSNLQYVGSGRYRLEHALVLQEGIASDFIASAKVDTLYWSYRYLSSEDTTKPRQKSDSSLVLKVSAVSQSLSGGFDCRVAETPQASCEEALVQTIGSSQHVGTVFELELGTLCKKLFERYGTALNGKHLYLQLRPPGGVQMKQDNTTGCIDPYVVDLYF